MTRPERENIENERINHFLYNGKTAIDLWCDAVDALVRIKSLHDYEKISDSDYVVCVKSYRKRIMNHTNYIMMCAVDGSDTSNLVTECVTNCGNYRFSYAYPGGIGGTNDCNICDEYDNVQFGIWNAIDDANRSLSDLVSCMDCIIDNMTFTSNIMFRAMCK